MDDDSWFEYFSDVMGEEEAEDSEKEEETNKREFDCSDLEEMTQGNSDKREFMHRDLRYHSVFREVFSPPPESVV